MEAVNPEGHKEKFDISLEKIMTFATGMPEEPPMGFQPKPSLVFHSRAQSTFPTANTCANQISIPLNITSHEEFTYNLTFGITNCAGFGQI